MRNETPRIKHTYIIPTMRIRISVGERKKKSNNNNNNNNDDKNSARPLCANGGQHVCCAGAIQRVHASLLLLHRPDPQRDTTTRVDVCGIRRKNTVKKKLQKKKKG